VSAGARSAPDPAGKAYSTTGPLDRFKGQLLLRGGEERGYDGMGKDSYGEEEGVRGREKSRTSCN